MPEETQTQDEKPTEVIEQPAAATTLSGDFNPPDDGDARKSLPKDVDKTIVNFDDFKKIIDEKDPNKVPEKKDDKTTVPADNKNKEKQEPTGEKKDGEKATEQPKAGDKELPGVPQQPLVIVDPKKQQEEDIAKYGEAAVKLLPKMAKEAREFLKARLDDNKQLQEKVKDLQGKVDKREAGQLPDSYLEHPEAYQLDPRYAQSSQAKANLGAELNYWRQQLILVRDAKPWKELTRDEKGNLVTIDREPNAEADVEISEKIQMAQHAIHQHDQFLVGLQNQFKGLYQKQRSEIQAMEDQYLPAYAGDKAKDNKYIQTFKGLLKERGQENNPLASTIAKMYAFLMEQTMYIQANEAKWNAGQKPKVEVQPNSQDINNAGGEKKVVDINNKPFDLKEWEALKEA